MLEEKRIRELLKRRLRNCKIASAPLLTQNRIETGRAGWKQRKIFRTVHAEERQIEQK